MQIKAFIKPSQFNHSQGRSDPAVNIPPNTDQLHMAVGFL